MRARILARKPKPGNRGGLHYSQFRRYLATQASQIQLLAFRPRRENRRPLSPIREVGLSALAQRPGFTLIASVTANSDAGVQIEMDGTVAAARHTNYPKTRCGFTRGRCRRCSNPGARRSLE